MRHLLYLFLTISTVCCKSNSDQKATTFFPANDEDYSYSGRFAEFDKGVELINSAASVNALVYGDSVSIQVESGNEQHQYISVEFEKDHIGRFRIKSDTLKFALPENREKTVVTIYKDTEASNGSVLFHGISAEKIQGVIQEKKPLIEFIGNSITCGMGADTREIACEDGEWYDQHNAYLAYGPRVSRALNANFVLNCVSGMGMYRNWNDEDMPIMADVYPTLRLNGDTSEMADRDYLTPDIVSIALGTNDLSLGDGIKERTDFDQDVFTNKYIEFVEMIFNKYPNTKVVLLSSPMIGEKESDILVTSLNEIKEHFSEKELSIFTFDKMEPGGCTSHPDIDDHSKMADKLTPFFGELLN